MILVISSHITNRLKYVLDFIGNCYPELDLQISNSMDGIAMKKGDILIEYNKTQTAPPSIFFEACGLLEATNIQAIDPAWDEEKQVPKAFVNSSMMGYDVFASIFFQLTRYEEYIATELDALGRFKSSKAMHVQANKELEPMVDLHIQAFLNLIANQYLQ